MRKIFAQALAQYVRQHEKALANSLRMSVQRRNSSNSRSTITATGATSSSSSALAAALSFAGLNFRSHALKAALLTLTPHHLFYLLSRMEELDITVGAMNIRLENLTTDPTPHNYVSFLGSHNAPKGRSDKDSIHSVSSMRSVMSSMSSFWSSIGLGGTTKTDKAKALSQTDLTYLYSAFTKLPSLRLTVDHRARLIQGYEEFPFDTAVPLFAFKNLQQLDIVDLDFRQFFGWDRLAEQLTLLTVRHANISDPAEVLTNIVLDDAEKRRRRSTKASRGSPIMSESWPVPSTPRSGYAQSHSDPGSPVPGGSLEADDTLGTSEKARPVSGSVSPKRPPTSRPASSYRHIRTYSSTVKRAGSTSSYSSEYSMRPHRSESSSSLLSMNVLPASKWQRLKYLSLADNSLTTISAKSLAPVASTLRSLNLSSNLFNEIPDSLASLTRLVSIDLSNCMIESLQSLLRSPLPAVLTVNLKGNRLRSLAGVERLLSLEQLNVSDNQLTDPMEMARLTGIPNIKRVWVKRNPFTKINTNYRVITFNLFRKTPGYVEDIVIDDSGPGFTERKQLVDRVPELERQLVQPSIRIVETPVILQHHLEEHPSSNEVGDLTINSTRRKGPVRRRMVDLTHDESLARVPDEDLEATLVPAVLALKKEHTEDSPDPVASNSTLIEMEGSGSLELSTAVPSTASSETIQQEEDYRSKVEALRQQFGNNWLSALGDQGWHNSHQFELMKGHNLGHDSFNRAGQQQVIVNGGRTLG
jgi:hypothetical protein